MRTLLETLTLILLPALAATAGPGETEAAAPAAFHLRDGDRVVFYGDSITQDGGYARLVEEYVATRFPGWDVRFYNAGVGGDTVAGGWAGSVDVRLERDVVAHAPTVVTLMLGMNDGGYKRYDPPTFARYAEGYRAILARLRETLPEARVTVILPSPFDDVAREPQFKPGYDDVLRRFGCYVGALARERGLTVADFRGPLNRGLAAVAEANPALAKGLLPDRVHPSGAGHLLMGTTLLRTWGAPGIVSRVVIDAAEARVVSVERSDVSALAVAASGLTWTQRDQALPLPLSFDDADVELAERAGAGIEELDRQLLQVSGLARGRHELRIDGQVIATFSAEELSEGVNLARFNTPMRWQAYPARWGAESRHELQRVRRELLAQAGDGSDFAAATTQLAERDEATQRERREALQPKPRTFELRPVD